MGLGQNSHERFMACLVIVFENCLFFFLKNKGSKKNAENTCGSIFFFLF